ncbi:hypothetical protein BXO559_17965, partial [Xanthomonas oryzae pv. oryzae]
IDPDARHADHPFTGDNACPFPTACNTHGMKPNLATAGNGYAGCPGPTNDFLLACTVRGPVQQAYPLPAFAKSVCIPCLLQAMGKGHALSPVNG